MPDVFVNYRKDDGDQAAATIARELDHRFDEQVAFRASESIGPSQEYPEALLTGLRRSTALLVLVGPRWIEAPDPRNSHVRALESEDDWVRKEILEGFALGLPVIPVLLGRRMERLDASALPQPLARLAYLQSLRYDPQQATADLTRIGDALTDLVPRLAEREKTLRATPEGRMQNISESGDGDGSRFQARDISGGITTTHIGSSSGPVNTGTGDQNVHNQSGGDGTTFVSGDNFGDTKNRFGGSGRRHRRDQP